jgi:hypothetical protein
MATVVTVNSTTGTLPLDIWVCDSCTGASPTCQYIGTTSTFPYDFTLPSIYESSQVYSIKFIDDNGCVYCEEYSYYKQFEGGEVFFFNDGTPYEFQ